MYAIRPLRGVGWPVGARAIRAGWALEEGETFAVDHWDPSLVLGDDQQSLRPPTQAEIDAINGPLPDEERIDSAFPQSDSAQVIFEVFFEMINRIIALEGGDPITKPQLRDFLKSKLP